MKASTSCALRSARVLSSCADSLPQRNAKNARWRTRGFALFAFLCGHSLGLRLRHPEHLGHVTRPLGCPRPCCAPAPTSVPRPEALAESRGSPTVADTIGRQGHPLKSHRRGPGCGPVHREWEREPEAGQEQDQGLNTEEHGATGDQRLTLVNASYGSWALSRQP